LVWYKDSARREVLVFKPDSSVCRPGDCCCPLMMPTCIFDLLGTTLRLCGGATSASAAEFEARRLRLMFQATLYGSQRRTDSALAAIFCPTTAEWVGQQFGALTWAPELAQSIFVFSIQDLNSFNSPFSHCNCLRSSVPGLSLSLLWSVELTALESTTPSSAQSWLPQWFPDYLLA